MEGDVPEMLWYLLAVAFVLFAMIGPIWFGLFGIYRHNTRLLSILRIYAERGEDPPAAVLEALKPPNDQQKWGEWPARTSRGAQLQQFVHGVTFAAVAAAIAWWRTDAGGPQWLIYLAAIAAIVIGAGAIGRLIAALATPRNDG